MGRIKIAVVCHQGLGSSLWLKVQVEKVIAKHRIPAHVFQTDLDGLSGRVSDIAVGVNYLGERLEKLSKSCIIVDNILDEGLEQKLLQNSYIKQFEE